MIITKFKLLKRIAFLSFLLILFSNFFQACYYDSEEDLLAGSICDTTTVSYTNDIDPILNDFCYVCHSIANADISGDGYILETYDELLSSTNGDDLINVIDWVTGGPANMPKSGSQLPSCERAKIRKWVTQGQLNN